jgi:hypothetical protein
MVVAVVEAYDLSVDVLVCAAAATMMAAAWVAEEAETCYSWVDARVVEETWTMIWGISTRTLQQVLLLLAMLYFPSWQIRVYQEPRRMPLELLRLYHRY